MKEETITVIDPHREYSLREIVNLKLVPGINNYFQIYNLTTEKVKGERVLFPETTRRTIKARHLGKNWNKINGKIVVKGIELLKFLKINGILK